MRLFPVFGRVATCSWSLSASEGRKWPIICSPFRSNSSRMVRLFEVFFHYTVRTPYQVQKALHRSIAIDNHWHSSDPRRTLCALISGLTLFLAPSFFLYPILEGMTLFSQATPLAVRQHWSYGKWPTMDGEWIMPPSSSNAPLLPSRMRWVKKELSLHCQCSINAHSQWWKF